MIDGMNEEHLYSVMVYAGALGKELSLMGSDKPAANSTSTSAANATAAAGDSNTNESGGASATTTTTTEIAGAKTTTTTTTTTTGVPTGSGASGGQAVTANADEENIMPPTPQQATEEATPPPIQLTRRMQPAANTIVKIVPRCFHFGCTENSAECVRRSSVKNIVHTTTKNNLYAQEQALALQQAIVHPLVRSIAKSAGVIDNKDFMIKNYIISNMKTTVKLALKTNLRKGRAKDDILGLWFSQLSYHL